SRVQRASQKSLQQPFDATELLECALREGALFAGGLARDHPGEYLNVYRRDESVVGGREVLRGYLFDEALVAFQLGRFGQDAADPRGLFGSEPLRIENLLRSRGIAHLLMHLVQTAAEIAADANEQFGRRRGIAFVPVAQLSDERLAIFLALLMDEELLELI